MTSSLQNVIDQLRQFAVAAQSPTQSCIICGRDFELLFPEKQERCQLCADNGLSAHETKTLLAWASFKNAEISILVIAQVARITGLNLVKTLTAIKSLREQGYLSKTAIYGYHNEFEGWGDELTETGRDFLIQEGALS